MPAPRRPGFPAPPLLLSTRVRRPQGKSVSLPSWQPREFSGSWSLQLGSDYVAVEFEGSP